MDFLSDIHVLDRVGSVAILLFIAWMVITDRLVWHTRLKSVQERADKWENIAMEALQAGARAGVQAAETTVAVVSAIPDPARDKSSEGR